MQDARCLKVKPRERAFKQFKSPVLKVLILNVHKLNYCYYYYYYYYYDYTLQKNNWDPLLLQVSVTL